MYRIDKIRVKIMYILTLSAIPVETKTSCIIKYLAIVTNLIVPFLLNSKVLLNQALSRTTTSVILSASEGSLT